MDKKSNLVWIDLEMTGLDPKRHVILEIATIITNKELEVIAEGPTLTIQPPANALEQMDEWPRELHTSSGLLDAAQASKTTVDNAEEQTLNFIQQYCNYGVSPLCGNSVWQDKTFLQRYMPRIVDFLHYRIIDVTSIKELVLRWYSDNPHAEFKKKDTHRALDDIIESIEELRYYRKNFFV